MFSFQFGTFESSTPGLFDWLSILVAALSVLAAYWLSERSFKKEQNAQLINEKNRADNDINLFKEFLLSLLNSLDKQEKDLNNLIKNPFRIVLSLELNTSIVHHIDFNRIFFNYPQKVHPTNKLLIYLEELNSINKTIQNDSRNYSKDTNYKYEDLRNINILIENKFHEICKVYEYKDHEDTPDVNFIDPIKYIIELEKTRKQVFQRDNFLHENNDENFRYLIDNYLDVIIDLGEKYEFHEAVEMENLARTVKYKFENLKQRDSEHIDNLKNKRGLILECKKIIMNYLKE